MKERTVFAEIDEKWCIDKTLPQLANISDGRWENLSSTEEKLDILQIISNIEARFLGVDPLWVRLEDFKNPMILSAYSEAPFPSILINKKLLSEESNGRILLNAVIHEVRHAYQRKLVALYKRVDEDFKRLHVFHEAPLYESEFENYPVLDKEDNDFGSVLDYTLHYSEIEARAYANFSQCEYWAKIQRYIEKNERII